MTGFIDPWNHDLAQVDGIMNRLRPVGSAQLDRFRRRGRRTIFVSSKWIRLNDCDSSVTGKLRCFDGGFEVDQLGIIFQKHEHFGEPCYIDPFKNKNKI